MAEFAKDAGASSSAGDYRPVDVAELENILTFSTGGLMMMPSRAFDEVYTNLFIGDESTARNLQLLKRTGVTHVVNTACGPKDGYHVNVSNVYYKKSEIEYKAIEATDTLNFKICQHFSATSDFIHDALESGGKVLVFCRQGMSRSATIVLAYLMMKQGMPVKEAVRSVRAAREICPNEGFLQQLCDFNDSLHGGGAS